MSVPVDETPSLDFARRLLTSQRPAVAILYLAHVFPRREAVWWARQCVEAILGAGAEDDALRAAEAWVRQPDEVNRRVALDVGRLADRAKATTWLALAAGQSGGSLAAPEQKPMPPQPSACAGAANAAIILAAVAQDARGILPWICACAEAGIRFADSGEAKVVAPAGVASSISLKREADEKLACIGFRWTRPASIA